MPVPRARSIALASLLFAHPAARAQVFADFETELQNEAFGTFTVQLDHDLSPITVAHFIRLAEGLVPWIDPATGELRSEPFYDGLEFHATIPGVEIAGGSPTNDGEGGPGYLFRDDFRSPFPDQWAIFLENDGPNTNGSRFFINLTASLNPLVRPGDYTRFGQVLQLNPQRGNGRAVVAAISQSAPGFVTIEKVTMRYVGAGALAFRASVEDSSHPYLSKLPTPRDAVFTFRRTPTSLFLDWDDVPGSFAQLWSSTDLQSWIGPFEVRNVPGSGQFGYDLTATLGVAPTAFFRGAVVAYPDWPSTSRPLANAAIQTSFFDPNVGALVTTYAFDESGATGAYASALGSGSFEVTRSEILGPYARRLELTPTSGRQPAYRLTLHYDLAWNNTIPSIAHPITANPSRLGGENLAHPGTALQIGRWTYVP